MSGLFPESNSKFIFSLSPLPTCLVQTSIITGLEDCNSLLSVLSASFSVPIYSADTVIKIAFFKPKADLIASHCTNNKICSSYHDIFIHRDLTGLMQSLPLYFLPLSSHSPYSPHWPSFHSLNMLTSSLGTWHWNTFPQNLWLMPPRMVFTYILPPPLSAILFVFITFLILYHYLAFLFTLYSVLFVDIALA